MSKDKQVQLNPTVDFIAGTISGMTSLVVGFPFDTVKVRFQNPEISKKYRSTLHAMTTIIREEKFSGSYKGIATPMATLALMNGSVFASYKFFMKLQLPNSASVPSFTQIGLAGAGSGIVSAIITTPTELIKIRQQNLLIPTRATQVAWQIFRESGITGLFRGFTATSLRDCGYGPYFAAYEATCRHFSPPSLPDPSNLYAQAEGESNTLSWPALLLAGGAAGIAGWIVTFPFDVVKTRVQSTHRDLGALSSTSPFRIAHSANPTVNPFRSTWSTIVHSYRTEGCRVFYRGLSPTLIRAVPVNMVTFFVFETVIHALS